LAINVVKIAARVFLNPVNVVGYIMLTFNKQKVMDIYSSYNAISV